MNRNYKLERLQNGETFVTKETGNSMVPLIKSKQEHVLSPVLIEDVVPGDIVYCKVKGNWYTHLVKAIEFLENKTIEDLTPYNLTLTLKFANELGLI
jgi:hypothetical protein